ncbi:MAG: hypothetical protein WA990_12835, partial [Rubrobacteraceae bacterium]
YGVALFSLGADLRFGEEESVHEAVIHASSELTGHGGLYAAEQGDEGPRQNVAGVGPEASGDPYGLGSDGQVADLCGELVDAGDA